VSEQRAQPVSQGDRNRKIAASVAGLQRPDHEPVASAAPDPLADLDVRAVSVERQVARLEREELGAAHTCGGQELEHRSMLGVDQRDNQLHRVGREGLGLILVLFDPLTVRKYSLGRRVVRDRALAPGRGENDPQRFERVSHRAIREGAAAATRLPHEPADEVSDLLRADIRQSDVRTEVPERVPLQ
jgi:hypothetical protein